MLHVCLKIVCYRITVNICLVDHAHRKIEASDSYTMAIEPPSEERIWSKGLERPQICGAGLGIDGYLQVR